MRRAANVEDRLRSLEKEIASFGDELASLRLRLGAEAEAQGVEIAALKHFLALAFPDFRRRFPRFRDWAVQENRAEPAPEEAPTGC